VGDERAHAARLGEGQRLAVVGLGGLGVEPVGMGRDVAEQVQRMRREPGVTRRGFDRAVAQAPG
jgi:D-arabinose 1-dehydrogenase-like Zn-dependent alcohol dehydrogenase